MNSAWGPHHVIMVEVTACDDPDDPRELLLCVCRDLCIIVSLWLAAHAVGTGQI